MDNFDAHKWFKKQYLEEGHSLEIDDLEQLKIHTDNLPEDTLSDKSIKRILNSLIKSNSKSSSRRRVVDYDNRDDRTTELFLDNGDSVEVDVIELYDNLKENNPED